jgi:transcription antitermination factor NusG
MKVKIAYGGFKGEAGVIKKINLQNKTASIEVNSFGRKQLQVIDFHDIEFIEE